MSRARRPIHLYDDDFTFDEPGHGSTTVGGNGGRDLFTNSDHLMIPDSPLSKHVREFDTMLAANKSQQQQRQRRPPPTLQPALNAASDNGSGMASPDTPRTLAFRQKISSLGSACRNASARSAEARGQGRRPLKGQQQQQQQQQQTTGGGMEYSFGNSVPRLPTREVNQHGILQPEMWPHQKSQMTYNEAQDNYQSQTQRKTSKFSSGNFRGGATTWRQTPIQSNMEGVHNHSGGSNMTMMPPPPSQRNRVGGPGVSPRKRSTRQRSDAGLDFGMNHGDDGGDDDDDGGGGGGGGGGGPDISIISDGMQLGGGDGDPFTQYDTVSSSQQQHHHHHQQQHGGSPRLNGAIARAGANAIVKMQKSKEEEKILVKSLPDVCQKVNNKGLAFRVASGADMEDQRKSNVRSSNVRSSSVRSGKNSNKRNGPRIRRKQDGIKKELPSYMRPTAATKQWKQQTQEVKKQPKAIRKKQIY